MIIDSPRTPVMVEDNWAAGTAIYALQVVVGNRKQHLTVVQHICRGLTYVCLFGTAGI